MPGAQDPLSDTHVLGAETRSEAVCADGVELPEWLSGSPLCKLLAQHRIVHSGIMEARSGFEVRRHDQSGTFFLACFGGVGSILSDGGWRAVKPGSACLLTPHTVNALKIDKSESWSFAWVRYLEPRGGGPGGNRQLASAWPLRTRTDPAGDRGADR